jgi:AcrR family transcriptional regulator
MGKRREDVEETRRRIVQATVRLHGTVGPRDTTFSAVAAEAGVQRSTVYRHFPDEEALFGACTSHWFAGHPWPRAEEWRGEPDPVRRLERALLELYRYYEQNEQMLDNALRDVEVMPSFVGELLRAHTETALAVLGEAWPTPGDRRRVSAIRLALDLRTWQSLESSGMAPHEASALMASMVRCASPGP